MGAARTTEPARDARSSASYGALARRPVTEMITEMITERVRSGELRPGDKLPAEPELARQLQVGRGTLREAIRTLHTLGVLQVVRGRGTYVAEPISPTHSERFVGLSSVDGPDLAQVLELRIALETAAVSLACVRATAADLDAIRARVADHEDAAGRGDVQRQLSTDEQFHDALVAAAHNPSLYSLYQSIVPQMSEFRFETLKLERSSQRFVPGHREIVNGIENHSPRESSNAAARHIAGLYNELRIAVEESGSSTQAMLTFGELMSTFVAES